MYLTVRIGGRAADTAINIDVIKTITVSTLLQGPYDTSGMGACSQAGA